MHCHTAENGHQHSVPHLLSHVNRGCVCNENNHFQPNPRHAGLHYMSVFEFELFYESEG